jgi:protein gp37
MSDNSAIEWTDATWNPITGCTKISPGCQHCYAETFAERFRGVPGHPYEQGFDLKLWPDRLVLPFKWKKQKYIFVNSMSDLFHKDVPESYIKSVFETMNKADWHVYQVLTKRADRLALLSPTLTWTKNIWAGVSVENADYLHRIDYLKQSGARIKFLSVEPLLGPMSDLGAYIDGIDWIIVGGESGHGARPLDIEWVREIRDICVSRGVKFFFKQWGGKNKKRAGRILDGRTWDERPL